MFNAFLRGLSSQLASPPGVTGAGVERCARVDWVGLTGLGVLGTGFCAGLGVEGLVVVAGEGWGFLTGEVGLTMTSRYFQ